MQNVEKWPKILYKACGVHTARFLKNGHFSTFYMRGSYHIYTISDRYHNGMKIIPDRLSVYTFSTQMLVVIFILDSHHNAMISNVIRYV